ncbi:dual-action HEIGH metallo-peptidase [Gillisia mitskevichiae]|uniref:Dual-action HEIGH metallo-peptidase n=1 Tax=Gillisia mitskevichiae TaxID=270921 RepID=A0A495Q047_9FLAO|nr:M57 family metalloprotease [Gillisia mitskevichiae]RKS56173.1 dual-action HEIGH metallo-peptidase [Gillisia mitskevichiae]
MKTNKLFLFLAGAGILFTSCEKDELTTSSEEEFMSTNSEVPESVLQKIAALHFNPKGAEVGKIMLPDGSFEKTYIVEGDIALSANQLNNMSTSNIQDKQYRTNNLVSNNRTIRVIGYTGGSQALTSKQRTALQYAINNYNALNIGLSFTLTFGTSYSSYDIVVYQTSNGQAGGVAGFPANGNPYKYVQIFNGMEQYSVDTNEHVMTHEIGHTLGMRHTDWFSRQSCGQSGEAAGSDGAVHIPGTPTGFDSTSIMLACFSANEDGEFGANDITALNYLY